MLACQHWDGQEWWRPLSFTSANSRPWPMNSASAGCIMGPGHSFCLAKMATGDRFPSPGAGIRGWKCARERPVCQVVRQGVAPLAAPFPRPRRLGTMCTEIERSGTSSGCSAAGIASSTPLHRIFITRECCGTVELHLMPISLVELY